MTQLEPPSAPATTTSGPKPTKPFDKKNLLLVLSGLLAITACATEKSNSNQESVAATTPSPTVYVAPTVASNSNETVSQENARESAESYLDLSGFSRSGLIKQLEFEGYSTEDATYGVDAQNANWNDHAARSAKSYLDLSGFSSSGLIKQLEFEGYTQSQAEYGVATQNANWNDQAARSAKSYLDLSSFSRSGLITQLKFEGYTQSQAEYGASANGL